MTPDPMPRPTEDELLARYHEAAALQGREEPREVVVKGVGGQRRAARKRERRRASQHGRGVRREGRSGRCVAVSKEVVAAP